MEPTLFGLSKAEWDFFNSFSNWLSAIATTAAVIVSLYLARRAGKPRAAVSVGHRVVITPGDKAEPPEIISFRIVNTGDRSIRITSIGWQVGIWRKRYAMQISDENMSSPMPIELAHGQEAHWSVPLNARKEGWLEYFAKKMLQPNIWVSTRTLKAQFHTSVGEVFTTRPESELCKKLLDAGRNAAKKV